ncbi:MBG domain-containing protein [Pedobacter sp. KR3-3]|uniref:MBG domain-containing protein n=1 Tax=Pedobacter albus TaxID=3113905 RepID=A0ABU7I674_9SPHI|nr:MBG domain-containing protein [Pedobacter sp. KR3-3]MEE1944980.1 MBG domain-containing protein [Pedobacter sp. KR3-3]
MKKIYLVKCFVWFLLLGFALASRAQTTYNFDAGAVISQPPGSIWNTQANITIGGIAYKLTACCNGGFSNSATNGNGNSASLQKDGSGGDTFVLERADGQPFQFYGFYVGQESINSYVGAFPGIPPFYEITYAKTVGAPEVEVDNTPVSGGTYTTGGKVYTKNLTVTQVSILFKANNRYWIDDIRVGVVAGTEVAPTVTSAAASAITSNSATLGGNVTADGGASVTERGIVWSTSTNPTTADNKVTMGSGTGTFNGTVGSLPLNTTIYFRAYAINSKGTSYGSNLSFATVTPTIVVNPVTTPGATVGVVYSQTFTGSGGATPYTFALNNGTFPTGLTLNPTTGTLSGTPTSAGTFNFTIKATDNSAGGGPFSGTRAYTIVVAPPVTVVAPTTVSSGTVGTSYSQTISASGGIASYTYSITAGSLPAGTSLNGATGSISGTPTAGGTFNFTVTATGSSTGIGSPHSGSRAYTLIIAAPTIVVNPTTLPAPSVGVAYSQTITSTGGTSPRSFAVTAGFLPSGVTLNGATGVLSGTPSAAGAYNFTVTATDASTGTGPYTGSRAYSFTIGAPAIVVNPATVSGGAIASAYSQNITASGGTLPYSFAVTAGSLPAGTSLNGTTGSISGTPTAGGTFNFTITATDATGGAGPYTGSKAYSLVVAAPSIALAPTSLPGGTVASAYSQTITSTGGTSPYIYSVTSGTLPNGLTLSLAGVLSGTPTAGGSYTFDISTTDSSTGLGPYSTTKTYTVNINFLPQTITLASTATANYGDADIDPGATSSSGLGVTYSTSDPTIATIVAGKVHIVGAGTVNVFANQAGNGTYAPAAQKTQVLTINKAALTYVADASSKVYGTVNPGFTGTVTGFKYADNLGNATTGTVAFSSAATNLSPIGTYAINGSGLTAANYTFAQGASNATALTITPKAITVTADAGQGKIYGTADPALTYSITTGAPLIGTDAFTGALVRAIGENVGPYVINQGNLALNANYTLTYVNASFAITPKAVTVAANSGQTKVYGSADPALTYSITVGGPLVGTDAFTGTLARVAGENVGPYVINQGTLALNANYSLSYTSANFAITPKAITVTASAAQNKTYGQADPTFAYAITAGGPLVGSDAFTGALARVAGENVGPYAINQGTLALNGNYTLTYTSANFTINPAALTITADNKERFFGGVNPPLTASYTGFVNGETNAVLTTQPALATVATPASAIGDYPITVNGAVAQNYTIAYVNGVLKVKAGAPTNIILTGVTLYENRPAGTNAGSLSSTSDDPSATFTYSLVSGAGDTDNALFAIAGTNVNTTASLDFENKASYSIRVKSITQFGLSLEKVLTIALSDVNEVPTLAAINNVTHCYTTVAQTVALSGISAGPETTQTTTISVTSNNAALFESLTATKNGTTGSVNYVVKNGASGVATVIVTIKDNGGTANGGVDTYSRSFTVTVNPLPVVTIASDKGGSISKGDIARLTASGGTSYVWMADNSIISGQNTAVLTVRPQVNTVYTVTVTNANSCAQSQSFTLNVVEDYAKINASNILTPNNDGYNDKWIIDNIDFYPNNEVTVFDRAGRIVYKKKGYDNSWDGTVNGSPLSENTYYYVIDFGTSRLRFKGYITILRSTK